MKLKVLDFDLKSSITSGEFFRYEIDNDSYIIILYDRVIKVRQEGDYLIVESNNKLNLKEIVIDFFSLDVDYKSINNEILNMDNSIKDILDRSYGFRMQKMPKFETLISYMISINNSVLNIKKCVDRLSINYGKKIIFDNKEYYLFPTSNELKNVGELDLRDMKLGFRAKYVKEMIDKVNNNIVNLNLIDNMTTEDAFIYLMEHNGIGLKVSSCILLFAYQKYDSYPIDVWVKRIMKERYNIEDINEIKEFIDKRFGKYSGIVIQYLFNYKRNIS